MSDERSIEVTITIPADLLEFVAKEVQQRKHRYLKARADAHRPDWKREQAERKLARLDEFTDLARQTTGGAKTPARRRQ